MKRILVTLLAIIGGLTVLAVAVGAIFAIGAVLARPGVGSEVVLELDLSKGLVEHRPHDPVALLMTEDTPTLRDVLDALKKGEKDERVKGLFANLSHVPLSPAHIQELRDAVVSFRKSGKKAVAFADSFGELAPANGAYYLATAFDEIYMQPSGDVGLYGIAIESAFARELFDKVGIQPQFEKRHEYKSAPETFTETTHSPASREMEEALIRSIVGQIARGVAEGRKLEPEKVRALIDAAPFVGQAAVEAGLVDGLLYRDEVLEKQKQVWGDAHRLFAQRYLQRAGRPYDDGEVIALVYGVGPVERGRGEASPLSDEGSMGSETVAAAIRKAAEDEAVKAIVFRVDSPGGSYVASDTIRREVQRAREKGKPVVVSMGSLAASGGYFVSMDAAKIVAQPATLTGSIGVFGGKFVTEGLWKKLGVNFEILKEGQNADFLSSDRPFSPEQREKLNGWLDRVYADFTQKAAKGRNMPLEKLEILAKGRVWTGEDAHRHGLVDALGGYEKALELAKEAAKIPADARVELRVYPRPKELGEALAEALGGGGPDNSDASAPNVRWPLLREVGAIEAMLRRIGIGDSAGALSSPTAEVRW